MTTTKLKSCLFSLLFVSTIMFGQTTETTTRVTTTLDLETKSPHHIGLHAGGVTGLGFSYRYLPGKFGFQITSIPRFSAKNEFVSIGLSGIRMLKENNRVDLFAYLGAHGVYTSTKFESFDPSIGQTVDMKTSQFATSIGLGLGTKITIYDALNLNLQAGYGVFGVGVSTYTFLTGEIGLYYQL